MKDSDMLQLWLMQRGYRMTEEGYKRITEKGYFGMQHGYLAAAMNHRPDTFSQYIEGCERTFLNDPRYHDISWNPAVYDPPPSQGFSILDSILWSLDASTS